MQRSTACHRAGTGYLLNRERCTAVLLGATCGGLLVSDRALGMEAAVRSILAPWLPVEALLDRRCAISLLVLLAVYGAAAVLDLGILDSGARYPRSPIHPVAWDPDFNTADFLLWLPLDRLSPRYARHFDLLARESADAVA